MNENKCEPQKLLNGQYLLLTLVNFLVSISYSMVSTIMARYIGSIGMTIALAGAVTGAFSLASMVARPFTGYINDHFDRKWLLIMATAGMGVCTLLYAVVPGAMGLFVVRVLHGAFFAFSSTVNMAVIPEIVPRNRVSEGISYFGVMQSIGVAAGPSVGLWLVNLQGFELNFAASGLLALGAAGLAFVLNPFRKRVRQKGEKLTIRLSDIIAVECLVYTVVDIAIASANGLENALIALYGAQQGISNIGWYFTISAVVLCVTRLAFGKVADKYGIAATLYPGLALMIAGFLLLWKADAVWMFAAASVLKTLGVGLARPAIQAACVQAVPPERRGSASSTYYIGSDIGQGTSPAVGGKIVDMTGGDYGMAFALYTLPLAAGAGVFALHNKRKRRKQA